MMSPYLFRIYDNRPVMIHGSIANDILQLPKTGARDLGTLEGYQFFEWGPFFYGYLTDEQPQDTDEQPNFFLQKLIRLIKIDIETKQHNRFLFKIDGTGFNMLYGKRIMSKIDYPGWSKELAYLDGWRFSTYGNEHILAEKIDEPAPKTLLLEQMLKDIRAFLEEDP